MKMHLVSYHLKKRLLNVSLIISKLLATLTLSLSPHEKNALVDIQLEVTEARRCDIFRFRLIPRYH